MARPAKGATNARQPALEAPPARLDLPDDQLGRLNLLTPDRVKKGVAEVQEGRTFCLSLPLDYPGGTAVNARRHPPRLFANKREGMPYIALSAVA